MQSALNIPSALSRLLAAAVDVLLPPRCLATGEIVDAPGMVSAAVWPQLQFIEAPFCKTCGMPFNFEIVPGNDILCAACMEREPVFDAARAAVVYNDISRKMILAFKYGDRLHAVKTFAPWMLRAGRGLIDRADCIIPVPLHNRRLRERRFNQSALLAREIASRSGRVFVPDMLLRTRHTVPQQGLNYKERGQNVKGAFALGKKHLTRIAGKNILLVDDVYTSGATLNECARVLKNADAASVGVLTVAKVTREEF
ncbi:MAG: ComF family protein [Alphaproteobacteria bacterium]|nr:ComF family protein [Alphaproteobacteria bacterium]